MVVFKIKSSKSESFLYTKDKQQAGMEMERNGHRKQYKESWFATNQTNQSSVWQEIQVFEEWNPWRTQMMENFLCSLIGGNKNVKIAILPKAYTDAIQSLTKSQHNSS